MRAPATKLSISIPHELAAAVLKRVGARGLSGFVARAISHELERERLGAFLAELEESRGSAPKSELGRARRARPKR